MPGHASDPHLLVPGHAPTPFTADDIAVAAPSAAAFGF